MEFEKTVYAFIKDLENFGYDLSCIDRIWNLIFPDGRGRWGHVHVTRYKETFYISHIDGNSCSLEVLPKKSVKVMDSFSLSGWEDGRDVTSPAAPWERRRP